MQHGDEEDTSFNVWCSCAQHGNVYESTKWQNSNIKKGERGGEGVVAVIARRTSSSRVKFRRHGRVTEGQG